ncbi:enoyl-[acyl-carrier-protein] reductase [NADPH] FabL [Desulfolithobacter dissulfuricans]|uniref:Enoyl-[acyl-carrier-protein] reductase [NADH] n=1 Tax=Desulfolithobacter dissulfuricans TaxID=2795293 RepID=A0A915U9A2_9BACT|nr:enoyl-[acyl-carrier-protein] reductase FabL [Desulfolithobacter dissulfuricans]BCO08180.1 enoyl-[acyl-carrier-protein] reductase [NADPH] FabL [Desulfolithobacter dissulfuricans]
MFDLKGKVALITGGSRGIGRAIALRLAENGVDVVVNYVRHRRDAEATVQAIEDLGGRCLAVKANVAKEEDVARMFEEIAKTYQRLDILVSNAASGVLKPVMELTTRHWNWAMDINARALLTLSQHAVPMMEKGGRIMAVSSIGAVRAVPNYTVVGASKAALESLVRHLAVELGPQGIHVNTISAGVVDTDALKKFPNRDEIISESLRRTPMGRLTTPDDVADVALFLCSDLARMIHGQTVVVDGGYAIAG